MPYKDPAKRKEANKKYQETHKEELKEKRKLYRSLPGKKEYFREAYIKYKYNITQQDIDETTTKQNNCCAICKEEKRLVVDHDHNTGEFRGMLCYACNTALGKFRDNIEYLHSAIKYLEQTK
jgi:hypothetical protein